MTYEEYAVVSKRFHDRLNALQFDGSLDESRYLMVDEKVGDRLDLPGLVSRRMLYVQLAFILNRTLIIEPVAADPIRECYLPQVAWNWRDFADLDAPAASFDIEQHECVVRFDYADFWANERLRRFFFPWAPPDFASYKCPRLLFDGETLKRLSLTESVRAQVDAAIAAVGLGGPLIGLHLGDGSGEPSEPNATLSDLLTRVASIAHESDVRRVLVTGSTDEEAIDILQREGLSAQIAPLPSDESLRDLIELELLSACDWVVGRVTADAPRLAAARIGLRTFRCDRHRLVSIQPERRGLGRLFARA